MRSLKLFGARRGLDMAVPAGGNRTEELRRRTILNNARLLAFGACIAMLPAMIALTAGAPLPFLLSAIALAGGMVALTLARNAQFDNAALAEVGTLLAAGLILTAADPQLADTGLAVALMGTVLSALTLAGRVRKLCWLALAAVFTVGSLGVILDTGVAAGEPALVASSITAFLLALIVVAHTAQMVGAAYVVHDKGQISAYRHLVEHMQDAILRFSGEGEILLATRSSEVLFGCPRYQLSGRTLSDRLHVLDRPSYLTAFADANQGGRARTIEVRMRQDDPRAASNVPQFIWVEIRFTPVSDLEGSDNRYEVIALLRDITGRKDAEAAMAEARRVAEDASQAKSRFLATIGHELRTPLNAVVGFSEMMSSGIGGELSPTHREYAGLIHQSGKHLLEVVRMLLDMSRIEAGRFEIQADPFAPGDVVPASFAMVETLAQQRDIELVSTVEPDLPQLVADERVCRQILINLLSNAIKFSHDGGTVAVSVKRQGQAINFSVRDYGIGMAPAAVDRIGEPFFQVQDGLTRQYEGTGLGLSIVKGLVELHGGTLRAISEIGAGTTMTVLLPINGPETKTGETADILPLHREPAPAAQSSWPNVKRKAQ